MKFMTHFKCLSWLLLISSWQQVNAESYWDGLVSYDPPLPMSGGDETGNAGLPRSGYELRSEGTTNGFATVNFGISSILMLFENPSEMPKEEIKTIADLKKRVDLRWRNVTNCQVTLIQFNGQDAVSVMRPISDTGSGKWGYVITFFWRQHPQWLSDSIFSVSVVAESRETFDKLVASLNTVKIRTTPPPVKLAKDEVQLGLTHDKTRQRCGEPFAVNPPDESYMTEKYLIKIDSFGPLYDKADVIIYMKVKDAQKAAFAAEEYPETLLTQILPINKAEAEEILKRKTNDGQLSWSSFAENRWKRSDGAMAALTTNNFVIVTSNMWPRMRF